MKIFSKIVTKDSIIPLLMLVGFCIFLIIFFGTNIFGVALLSMIFVLLCFSKVAHTPHSTLSKTPFDRFAEENREQDREIVKTLKHFNFHDVLVIKKLIGFNTQKKSLQQVANERGVSNDEIMVIWKKFTLVFNRVKV